MSAPPLKTWMGLSASVVDLWVNIDMLMAWEHLKENLPEGVVLMGLCPVGENEEGLLWAALAWHEGESLRGIGANKIAAIKALNDLLVMYQPSTEVEQQALVTFGSIGD